MHPSHPFWSQEVPRLDGQLLLSPCPGTQQVPLTMALAQLRLAGAYGVITLMTASELASLELEQLGLAVTATGMQWFHLPIADDHPPTAAFDLAWQQALPQLTRLLEDGKHLVIHCKGGSGRTGLVAAALLMQLGQPRQEAMAAVQARRPRAFTLASHREWLDGLARRLASDPAGQISRVAGK